VPPRSRISSWDDDTTIDTNLTIIRPIKESRASQISDQLNTNFEFILYNIDETVIFSSHLTLRNLGTMSREADNHCSHQETKFPKQVLSESDAFDFSLFLLCVAAIMEEQRENGGI
jgi:hypothetical protein